MLLVLANLFISEASAATFITAHYEDYKLLLKTLRGFVAEDRSARQGFFGVLFGFMTNVFYFENKQLMRDDFEMRQVKLQLVRQICALVFGPAGEPVRAEGLRTIANLCKHRGVLRHLFADGYCEGGLTSSDRVSGQRGGRSAL